MAETFDEQYLKDRTATDQWQSSQLTTSEGDGSLYNPFTSLSVDGPTDPSTDAAMNEGKRETDLKLSRPPGPNTPAEVVTDQPIKSVDRKTITVDTPEIAAVRQQFKDAASKLGTGEAALEQVGKAGKEIAQAVHPGLVVAGRAIGLDETQADALATGFVEFMSGLPGQDETDTAAGFETALAALPIVGAAVKSGKIAGKELAPIIAKEFGKATDILRSERGSIPLGKSTKTQSGITTPITWEEAVQIDEAQRAFDERLKTFAERVSKQRRGVRSDVQVTAESARPDAIQLEGFLDLPPGTILKDSDVVAVKRMFKDLAEPVRQLAAWVNANPHDEQAFLALLQQMPKVEEAVGRIAGVYAESGRTQRLLSPARPTTGMIPAKSEEKIRISDPYIKQWLDFFQQQDALAKVGAPALTRQKLTQLLAGMKTQEELMAAAKVMANPTKWDMFVEYWINGLLSSPATHATNIVSNMATIAWAIPERQIAALFSKEVRPSEALAMTRGIIEAQGDAWRMAWQAFKSEESQLGHGKMEGPTRAITADALALTGVPGRAVDFLGSMIRLPGRFLLAADDYFKAIAFRAEVRALAKREAYRTVTEANLTGQQAAREMQRIEQRILANPPDSIDDAAKEFAAYTTFTRDLGETGQNVQALAGTPLGRIILPFFRTPTNIFKYVGERTPLAFASNAVREELAAGGARGALQMAKISLGSMTMAYLGSLASEGVITGGGPKDKDLLKIKKQTGWQPYSIKVGNEYIALSRIEPFGSFLGIAADVADLVGQLPKEEADKLVSVVLVALQRNIANKTFVKGLAGTLNAASSSDVNVWNSFLEKELPAVIPASSLMRQLTRINDPVLREVNSIIESYQSKIPGYSSELPPTRNLWAEPILFEGGLGPDLVTPLYTSESKDDPVSAELVKQQIPIAWPQKNIEGVPLTPQEYDAFQRLAGGMKILNEMTLKERLHDLMFVNNDLYNRSSDGPDGGKKALIIQWVSAYRDYARTILATPDLSQQYLHTTFPELVQRVQEKREKRATQFNAQ